MKFIFMIAFYLFAIGGYLYYSQSKYYPAGLYKVDLPYSSWIAGGLFLVATGLYIASDGWTSGVLMAICAITLMLSLIQLVAVLGKTYFYGLIIAIHGLLLFDFIF